MPRKKRPKLGYEGAYLLSDDGKRIYPDSEIQRLATQYRIRSPDQIPELKTRLEGAALVYRKYKQNCDDAPTAGQMRAALDEIGKLVDTLQDRLMRMDTRTEQLLWRPESQIHYEIFIGEATETKFGHTIQRIPINENEYVVIYLRPKNIFEGLTILTNYVSEAKTKIPKDRGGRPQSEAIRMWVVNMRSTWTALFASRFAVEYRDGEARNRCTQFCFDAFKAISPRVPKTQIVTEANKLNRAERNRHSQINPPQN